MFSLLSIVLRVVADLLGNGCLLPSYCRDRLAVRTNTAVVLPVNNCTTDLLCCEALEATRSLDAFSVFERTFRDFGLPRTIRTDNGTPFASTSAFFGLSKLSVWWLRLGIGLERIRPGHPEQNGRHERMHLTLKREATRPAGSNFLQQQARFDRFIEEYNHERPHQALNMKYPAECYRPSPRPYTGLPELQYPFHNRTLAVT